MKVAIVVNELNIRGGTHKQVLRLCQYLKQEDIGFSLHTKWYDPEKTYPDFGQFPVEYLGKSLDGVSPESSLAARLKRRAVAAVEEIKLFRKIPKDADVVNIHDNELLLVTLLVKWFRRAKVVWQINDLPLYFQVGSSQYVKTGILSKPDRAFARFVAKRVDVITVNVSKNRERVQQYLNREAKVFYCGVDVNDRLLPHSAQVACSEPIRLLSTGVFFPYRNYETLVCVVEKLRQSGHDARLDIIGSTALDQAYAAKVRSLVEEKGMQEHVTIWGQVDDEKYCQLYNSADIFLFLNIDQSWGLAVFEAMSCGMPVLVSNSVGAIELLHHDEDALILDPKDVEGVCRSILQLTENPDYYTRISDQASQAVKDYTWDKLYSEKMTALFEALTVE